MVRKQQVIRSTTTTIAVEPLLKKAINEPKKRVGILGGTFNPPHMGHLIMADQVGTQLGLDTVYFMPDANPPHANHKVTINAHDRVEMVKRAIFDNPNFDLELAEIKRGGVSYTVDTMKQLTKEHSNFEYYFIIGGDMVADLPNWHQIDELTRLVQFVGVKRRGYKIHTPYPVLWVDAPLIDISSTQIRQKVACSGSIRYLVPEPVENYIKERQLYVNRK